MRDSLNHTQKHISYGISADEIEILLFHLSSIKTIKSMANWHTKHLKHLEGQECFLSAQNLLTNEKYTQLQASVLQEVENEWQHVESLIASGSFTFSEIQQIITANISSVMTADIEDLLDSEVA